MKDFFQRFKKYSHASYRVLLFLVAVAIIANLMPRERKFSYQFGKGEPWRYEVLIAPFDFRIYKTSEELELEQDSILKNFRPYFLYDSTAVISAKQAFLKSYESKLPSYKAKYRFLKRRYKKQLNADRIKELADTIFLDVFAKGIVAVPDEYMESKSELELMLVKGNLAEPYYPVNFLL